MGRPKGSKNKSKVDEKLQPKLLVTTEDMKASKKTKDTFIKVELKNEPVITQDYIRAVTELAVIAGRNFYLAKLQPWIDTFKDQDNLRIEVERDEDMKADVFTLYSGDDKLDDHHVFVTDIEDVVRGVLGAR